MAEGGKKQVHAHDEAPLVAVAQSDHMTPHQEPIRHRSLSDSEQPLVSEATRPPLAASALRGTAHMMGRRRWRRRGSNTRRIKQESNASLPEC